VLFDLDKAAPFELGATLRSVLHSRKTGFVTRAFLETPAAHKRICPVLVLQISASAVDGVIAQSSTGNPQIACRKYFEARYPGVSSDLVGNHPNIYFNEAYKAMRAKV
jgi:Eukaryotic and archaeal DNA primase, large subunit